MKRAYPSREGKRAVTVYLPKEDHRALRVLGALTDRSMVEVLADACREYVAAHAEQIDRATGRRR